MRVYALVGPLIAVSGCSLLFGLDGLEDGGAGHPDAASDQSPPPVDANASEGGRDGAPHDGSANEGGGGPGDASDASHGNDASDAACTPPTPPTLDDCTGLVALPAAPVIDGVLDCGVPVWPMPLPVWLGAGPAPSAVHTNVAVAWRPDGLYFFVSVTGLGSTRYPPPAGTPQWCGEAVELFVDDDGQYSNPPLYDTPGTIQLIAEGPSNAMTSTSTGGKYSDGTEVTPWTGQFIVVRTSDGFDGEAFVVAADLGLTTWSLANGGHVGLDVAVDLGDPSNQSGSCPRLGQFSIQLPITDASCPQAACNVYEFCNPQLGP